MLTATVKRQIAATRKINLITNPSFEIIEDDGAVPEHDRAGGYYIHVNNTGLTTDDWSATGSRSLEIIGTTSSFDTHFSPQGRNGAFRVGLRPGATYSARARVQLPHRLSGPLARTRLSISPGWTIRGEHHWNPRPSASAENAPGVHAISHRFTVPSDAEGAWIRYVSGMAEGGGTVRWDDLLLVEGDASAYFDGDTPESALHRHGWTGDPGRSTSFRQLRPPEQVLGGRSLVELADLIEEELVRHETSDELAVVVQWIRSARRRDPDMAYFEGRVALWDHDHDRAVARFDAARGAGASGALAELELGRLAHAARNFGAADAHFRAVARAEGSAAGIEAGYRVAAAMDRALRLDESVAQTRAVAARDAGLPFDIERALATDPKGIWPRRVLGRFVRDHLDEIRARALEPVSTPSALTGSEAVFTYWHQGFDDAPPIVARCHQSLIAHEGADRVHVLTGKNVGQYTDLPKSVTDRLGTDYTHLSDLIRLDLLTRFGGHWVDATCLLTGPIAGEPELTGQDFFCFNYSGPRVATWFMSSAPGGYEVSLLREALLLWWQREGHLVDYFLMHYMLEMLYVMDDHFRERWDASTHRHPRAALALQRALHQTNADGALERHASASWIHKLTYKSGVGSADSGTVAAAIVRGEHRGLRFER